MTTSIIQCNSYPDFYGAAPEYDENGLVMMLQFPTGMSGTRRGRDDNDDDNDNAHVSSPLKKRKTKDFADCHDEVKQEQQKQQETTTTPRRPQWLSDKFYFGPVEFDMWSPPTTISEDDDDDAVAAQDAAPTTLPSNNVTLPWNLRLVPDGCGLSRPTLEPYDFDARAVLQAIVMDAVSQ
mmetsp:Transcript_17682/g.41261  ORF Transcript_17682/g.41261 Transcript_17682/m.41261 type:complete len:180 (+) Transcript_17682:227-766(+)